MSTSSEQQPAAGHLCRGRADYAFLSFSMLEDFCRTWPEQSVSGRYLAHTSAVQNFGSLRRLSGPLVADSAGDARVHGAVALSTEPL